MKQKTNSSAKKRFKITWKWKYIFSKSCKNHLLSDKSKKAKWRDKYGKEISTANKRTLKFALPKWLK